MAEGTEDLEEKLMGLKNALQAELQQKTDAAEETSPNGNFANCTEPTRSKLSVDPTARRVLKGHFGKVYALNWAGQGKDVQLLSASQDGKLIEWNANSTNKVHAIPLRSSWVMTCAVEPTYSKIAACGGLDNVCSIYALPDAEAATPSSAARPKELAAHDGYLSCCRFIDEKEIVTSSGDSTCILWDLPSLSETSTFTDHSGDVMSVSINTQDNNLFASGSCDATARVWDKRQKACAIQFVGHESDINSVQWLPDGKTIATASDDSSCRIFDMRCMIEVNRLNQDKIICGISSVDCSKSGRIVFAGYDDYSVKMWDVLANTNSAETWVATQNTGGHENRVSCLGVNSKGEAMATGSWDTLLKVWA